MRAKTNDEEEAFKRCSKLNFSQTRRIPAFGDTGWLGEFDTLFQFA